MRPKDKPCRAEPEREATKTSRRRFLGSAVTAAILLPGRAVAEVENLLCKAGGEAQVESAKACQDQNVDVSQGGSVCAGYHVIWHNDSKQNMTQKVTFIGPTPFVDLLKNNHTFKVHKNRTVRRHVGTSPRSGEEYGYQWEDYSPDGHHFRGNSKIKIQ